MSSTILTVPTKNQARRWYEWALLRNHAKNPFHPTDGNKHKMEGQPTDIVFLAGITATTEPDHKPSMAKTEQALVTKSRGPVVYNDGNDKGTQKSPKTNVREIEVTQGVPIYVPISTELATETKYPNWASGTLADLAKAIIDSEAEDNKGIQPVFFELKDQQGNVIAQLSGNQVTSFLATDSFDNLDVPAGNIFMLPPGPGPAGFYDHTVIINTRSLSNGAYSMKFGINGKFFQYEVNYVITVK